MTRRRLLTFLVLCLSGVVLGTLGTWSWGLGHGYSAIWPALVVQVSGGIWFGAWGVLAAILFPVLSNTLAHVGTSGILGFIPANLAQGLVPAWAFRRFRVDPAIPGRKGLVFYLVWGAIIPATAGALLGALAIVLFGEEGWSAYPSLVWKWAVPHTLVSTLIGIPVMRIFTPLWRDLGILVKGWWGMDRVPTNELGPRKLRDLPIQLKLVLSMCGVGVSPLLALSLVELGRSGGTSNPMSPTPLFLTTALVASVLAVGWLSREVIRPLRELKEQVEQLAQGHGVSLSISREDEIGQVARAFELVLTGRRRAEQAVRKSAAQLQAFVETAPYGITRSSMKEDRFLSVNPTVVKMLGYDTEAEVLALRLSTDLYVDPEGRARLVDQLSEIGKYIAMESRWKRKDGTLITIRGSARLTGKSPESDELIIETIEEDITQQRLLEEQLRQAQKMEAVGRLAGGVAHDFNNLLGIMMGYSEMLLEKLHGNDPNRKTAESILEAVKRASEVTKQLLAFSHRQVFRAKVVDLKAVVDDAQKLLQRSIGEDIELTVRLGAGAVYVEADPGQLVQVIMNLALNSRDAMPEGGKLTIEIAKVNVDEMLAHGQRAQGVAAYVLLVVSDTGRGMDEHTQMHLYEPFFTTKELGKGTGLGLSTVYGIVKQSNGFIRMESTLGQGTTFRIYLPLVAQPGNHLEHKEPVAGAVGGSETILIAEDEPLLREVTRDSLQIAGYRVLEATDVDDAIRIAEQHKEPIHLLVTDMVMPKMSGQILAQKVRESRPGIPVIYVSGYAESLAKHQLTEANSRFLCKPFSRNDLLNEIHNLLVDERRR